jgi:hypothetical protein
MEPPVVKAFPERDLALLLFPERRLCRADQVERLFTAAADAVAASGVSRGVVSLEGLAFAREDSVREALARELSTPRGLTLYFAGGRQGDAVFLRGAGALARAPRAVFDTEAEALAALAPDLK